MRIRASGRTARYGYDAAGRLTSQTVDQRTVEFFYDADGNLSAVKPAGRERHDFGFTPVGLVSSYAPPSGDGLTTYTWNADRQLTALRRGAFAITLGYDAGGRLSTIAHPDRTTTVGYFAGGNVASVVAGDQSLAYTYDGFLLTGTSYSGAVHGSVGSSYDNDFRLASESVDGAPVTFGYDTDGLLVRAGALGLRRDTASGLLTAVEMGTVRESFTYDSFSQVAAVATTAATTPLLSFTYTRDAAGRIVGIAESSTGGASVTRGYEYDAGGRLVRVTDGTTAIAEYDYDANGNRKAYRWLGGTTTATYDGDDRLLVTSRFVYGSRMNVPDSLIRAGVAYRIISDHLGSPRLVVDTTTGAIVQALTYDEFGNILSDTNPGFQPFGFAGGLYDRDTRLVRFGARDYEPHTGRWTATDPIGFAGGDTNLYAYVASDPMNWIDPSGLLPSPPVYPPLLVPVPEGMREFLEGAGSYFTGLYRFGRHLARRSGALGDCAQAQVALEDRLLKHTVTVLETSEGRRAAFDAARSYVQNNPERVAGRMLTGVGVSTVATLALGSRLGIGAKAIGPALSAAAAYGDIRYAVEQGRASLENLVDAGIGGATGGLGVPSCGCD